MAGGRLLNWGGGGAGLGGAVRQKCQRRCHQHRHQRPQRAGGCGEVSATTDQEYRAKAGITGAITNGLNAGTSRLVPRDDVRYGGILLRKTF